MALAPPKQLPRADIAIHFQGDDAVVGVRTASGMRCATVPAVSSAIAAFVDSQGPVSRRTILSFPLAEFSTKVNPVPPGISDGFEAWRSNAFPTDHGGGALATGCVVFGDSERPFGLHFAILQSRIDHCLRILRSARLSPVSCVPAFLGGVNHCFQNLDRPSLIIDFWDSTAVTFGAACRGDIYVIRPLPAAHAGSAEGIADEARRTIHYVRERHKGLAIRDVFICGPSSALLSSALESDGLNVAGAPAGVNMSVCLIAPFSGALLCHEGTLIDLLPLEERFRMRRRVQGALLGCAGIAAATVVGWLGMKTHAIATEMNAASLNLGGLSGRSGVLAEKVSALAALRDRAAMCKRIMDQVNASNPAQESQILFDVLTSCPQTVQISELEYRAGILEVRGYSIASRHEELAGVEQFAAVLATRSGFEPPTIEFQPPAEGEIHQLGGHFATGEWIPSKFIIHCKRAAE